MENSSQKLDDEMTKAVLRLRWVFFPKPQYKKAEAQEPLSHSSLIYSRVHIAPH